jgi:hypothetical protein
MIVAELFPQPSTFKVPNDSMFAVGVLQARVDFIEEVQRIVRNLYRPWMGTTGANLARAAIVITEIESRYSTLVDLAIDEKMAKSRDKKGD